MVFKLKRYGCGLLALLITLSGCSSPDKPLEDGYITEADFPYMFRGSMYGTRVASSEQGYYFLNGNYLYYMDRQGTNPFLVDNRPDNGCLKEDRDTNCNAYISMRHTSQSALLQFYKDYLYVVESRDDGSGGSGIYELVRRNPDGSNRTVMRSFSHDLMKEAAIHRDDLYYLVVDYDKEMRQTHQILRLPLDNLSGEPEVLYEKKHRNQESSVFQMFVYGSQIYLDEFTEERLRMLRYDLNDASVSTIWERNDGVHPAIQAIHGQNVYFSYRYLNPDALWDRYDERSSIFYSSELDGSNIQETDIPSAPLFPALYMDDRYTYVRSIQAKSLSDSVVDEIGVYKNGKLLQKLDMSMYPVTEGLTTGDERFMFLFFITDDLLNIHYLDKNDIESGTAEFKPLIETPFEPK